MPKLFKLSASLGGLEHNSVVDPWGVIIVVLNIQYFFQQQSFFKQVRPIRVSSNTAQEVGSGTRPEDLCNPAAMLERGNQKS
jgi:hypothetical protein